MCLNTKLVKPISWFSLSDFYLLLLNVHWFKLQKRSKTKIILFSSRPNHQWKKRNAVDLVIKNIFYITKTQPDQLIQVKSFISVFLTNFVTFLYLSCLQIYYWPCLGFHSPKKAMPISVISPVGYFWILWHQSEYSQRWFLIISDVAF